MSQFAEGKCNVCQRILRSPKPADLMICDCWEFCPNDHGNGAYGTKMEPYTPDLTPNTYGPIKTEFNNISGDLKHPMNIFMQCPTCGHLSAQRPVAVKLT
jgi:hypothetical protein